MNMHKITPEYLTEDVNFHFTNENWKYDKSENFNTAKIQAEGAAKIFNLLIDNHIALLSDEVGMGKTYEALAVMVSLWRQKPDAKILLYAPNEIVALKWINDYHNFIRKNFKVTDDLVKSSLNEEILHKAVYCHNHIELMEQINKKWVSFYVCKTSSLSGLLSSKINNESLNRLEIDLTLDINQNSGDEEKMAWMYKLAKKFNEKAYENLSENGAPPFDLLIFDEAHYLRRTEPSSQSNRSIVAHAFFAGRNIKGQLPYEDYNPIASKVLLMTATPTHSSNEDVRTIISLFNPEFKDKKPEEILNEICVRRFRRLENKTKYEYREEIPKDVEIDTLREKLFFAAYQKSLVLNKARAAKEGKVRPSNAYRILFGYLEGFEFISRNDYSRQKTAGPKKEEDQQNKKDTLNGDFEVTDDSTIIKELSEKYHKAYRSNPAHPKYEKVVGDLLPFNSKTESLDKKLVFVRRIPSVNEISNRLVDEYDKRFKVELKQIVGAKRINKNNLRKFFYNIGKSEDELEPQPEEMNKEEEDNIYGVPKSKILNLFTVKKEGKYKATDCSNFRLRFIKDEQVFSVFFQPALDFQYATYKILGFITKKQNEKNRRLYQTTIKTYRKDKIQEYSNKLKIGIPYNLKDLDKHDREPIKLDTLIGIWLRIDHCNDYCKTAQKEYLNFSLFEKEGFSSYLEAGILFSSSYIIKFYVYYYNLRVLKVRKGIDLYNAFCKKIEKEIDNIGLSVLISKAVLTFKIFYKKELGLNKGQLLNEKNWNFLKSTIPVYPYNGSTKRPSILKAFNTPFYPNALIATSVLQEGVDLHYHCSNVIHYGIAWTPGDNEQRNGRVDRLFGKLHNDLKINPNTRFPIVYPYLKNTLDQYQLQRFIKRKHYSEELLDKLQTADNSKEVNLLERIDDDWKKYFNEPTQQHKVGEPYAVKVFDFDKITPPNSRDIKRKTFKLKDALKVALNTVKQVYGNEVLYYQYNNEEKAVPLVLAIKHIRHNGRHQPILIELRYFEPGLSWIQKPTYLLKIKTPLCGRDKCLTDIEIPDSLNKKYIDNPIIKINYSPGTKGYFKFYVSSELPIFIVKNNMTNLSGAELITAIKNVISFADNLENSIFNGENDVKNNDIIKPNDIPSDDTIENSSDEKILGEDRKPEKEVKDWQLNLDRKYYFKSKKENAVDRKQNIYEFNDQNHLIRKVEINEDVYLQIGLYSNDALDEEFNLMNKIFENIL